MTLDFERAVKETRKRKGNALSESDYLDKMLSYWAEVHKHDTLWIFDAAWKDLDARQLANYCIAAKLERNEELQFHETEYLKLALTNKLPKTENKGGRSENTSRDQWICLEVERLVSEGYKKTSTKQPSAFAILGEVYGLSIDGISSVWQKRARGYTFVHGQK